MIDLLDQQLLRNAVSTKTRSRIDRFRSSGNLPLIALLLVLIFLNSCCYVGVLPSALDAFMRSYKKDVLETTTLQRRYLSHSLKCIQELNEMKYCERLFP